MKLATIQVSGVQMMVREHEKIPAGIVGATVTFDFKDSRWDGLRKTAVFKGCDIRDVIMNGNTVVVPHETVAQPGSKLYVGILGVDEERNIQIPTLWVSLGMIHASADPSGDPSADQSLPVWAQLQEEIEALKENGVGGNAGENGGYYTPSVVQTDEGTMTVSFAASKDGMAAVEARKITLPAGKTGDVGPRGETGPEGPQGAAGPAGVSPTVDVSKSGKVTTITITDKNGTKTAAISDGSDGKDGTSEAGYIIPDFWQSALNTVIAAIKSRQVGKNCVTFPFFSDNHHRNGYAGMLIAEVMKQCHIPFCFYGGDSISNSTIADEAEMIAQDKAFDTMMAVIPNGRLCRAVGNHDGYWYDGTNKFCYDRNQVYELFLREESIAQNKQFGDDGTYYFVEDQASKVRFIVLNTNGGSVDDAQLAWFRDVALKVDEGWAVVVISHQPISNHYHANISNAADIRAIITESGVEMIGWFSGHIHRDRIYTGMATNNTDDAVGADMGFKQVTITSDHTGIAYEAATEHTVAEDNKSHAIDFVTINRDAGMVYLTRLGIGSSREYRYGAEPEPAYTNLADPASSDWLTDQRLNSSGGGTACDGAVVTNFIPITTGDVIRVKGINFADYANYTSAPKNGIFSSTALISSSAATQSNNTWTYSTENNGEIAVFTITAGATATRYRLSGDLIGTAEGVVITRNQEIE